MTTIPAHLDRLRNGYPESDGKPMAETDWHRKLMTLLIQMLEAFFAGQRVYVSGNLLVFYEPGNRRRHVSPDVFVVRGVENHERPNYLIWEERRGPEVVIELTSSTTKREDQGKKLRLYRDTLRVPEYFLFDPREDYLKPSFQGYRLRQGIYHPIRAVHGRLPSRVLGLHLERCGQHLRLWNPTTEQYLPTPSERTEEAEALRRNGRTRPAAGRRARRGACGGNRKTAPEAVTRSRGEGEFRVRPFAKLPSGGRWSLLFPPRLHATLPPLPKVRWSALLMRLFISAGEPSGDLHGASLIRSLRERVPNLDVVGFGGERMAEAGCRLVYPLCDHAVIGIGQVLNSLPTFAHILDLARDSFRDERPDALVMIDYPGFHWWLARAARKEGIPVSYFVPPQIWAWATWRAKKMRRLCDQVLCSLPFEEAWLRQRDIPARYIGHPYFDELGQQQLDASFLAAQRPARGPWWPSCPARAATSCIATSPC